jgi:hypothetical protein
MNFNPTRRLFLVVALLAFPACQKIPLPQNSKAETAQEKRAKSKAGVYGPPKIIAKLKSTEVTEGSGIVASDIPGIYWVHNDSGDGPYIYAVDDRGQTRGVFRVVGARARDWEDISAGPGPHQRRRYLYIGDTGNNNEKRGELTVYRIPEPSLPEGNVALTRKKAWLTEQAETIKLRYPDGNHDAETLLVHPVSGDLYLVTKAPFTNPIVYKAAAPLKSDETISLVRKAELKLPSLLGGILTGGSVSPDGRRVALCDYLQGYELVLPSSSINFDEIWQQPISAIDLGKRSQGEAITYRRDGKALLATSEGKSPPLIEVVRR